MKKSTILILSLLIFGACAEEKVVAPPPDCDESSTSTVQFQNGRISQIETDEVLEQFDYQGNTIVYTRYRNDTALESKHYYYRQGGVTQTSIDSQYATNGSLSVTHHYYTHFAGRITLKESFEIYNNGADTGSTSETEYTYHNNGNLKRISSSRPGVFDGSSFKEFSYNGLVNRGSVITDYYNPIIGLNSPNHPGTAKVKEPFKQQVPVEFTYEFYDNQNLKSITEYRQEPNGDRWLCKNYQY